jgi:quercetin dioxygenase-like cupin family protein
LLRRKAPEFKDRMPARIFLVHRVRLAGSVCVERKVRTMEITKAGSRETNEGNADWFTGAARLEPLLQPKPPARAAAVSVTFQPGARTAWHTHPLGQTLIVTSGVGRAQRDGGPVEEIRPGDVVLIPPGEKHWHGAAPGSSMTHIAIHEALDGNVVEWLEQVTDAQYGG